MSTTEELATKAGLPFDHVEYKCPGKHDDGGWECMFCAGGLFACDVCGAFEGATTTQCPGYRVSKDWWDEVYHCKLDYRNGHWVAQPSWYCPGGYYNWAWEYAE